jgi:cystathionine gamma-synthase
LHYVTKTKAKKRSKPRATEQLILRLDQHLARFVTEECDRTNRDPDGSYPRGHLYARNSNPTRSALEECLRQLDGGAAAAAFASGSAATSAVFFALTPGDHVIAPTDTYYGTQRLLREQFGPWGLEFTFVDMTDPVRVEAAVRPTTRLVWVETPSNPLWKVTDIARLTAIAHAAGARCVCDNTTATPALQRPLACGVDLTMYATTKFLGGHSDVLGGALVAREADDFWARVARIQVAGGAVPSPFDCWLVLRGLATLPYRMRGHCDNAMRVASFLEHHPAVEAVHYPGLASHPGHLVAREQMTAFGGMLSVQIKGGPARAVAVAARLRVFTRATSFGGTESLVEHRASIEGPGTLTPEDLLRLSIGLEHPDDLIEDFARALA